MLVDHVSAAHANIQHEYLRTSSIFEDCLEEFKTKPRKCVPRATEIKLPSFSGSYIEWHSWRAQYISRVYDVSEYSVCEKLDVLMASLSGEAATSVGLPESRTAEEFERIWCELNTQYDNPVESVRRLVRTITSLPDAPRENSMTIRSILDTFEQSIRGLIRFGFNTSAWKPLTTCIQLDKLSPTTVSHWLTMQNSELQRILTIRQHEATNVVHIKASTASANSANDIVPTHTHQQPKIYHRKRQHSGEAFRFNSVSPMIKRREIYWHLL